MIDLNEMIEMKWTTRNKTYYEEHGYKYTKMGDKFQICIKDLPEDSNVRVHVRCDCQGCLTPDTISPYRNYNRIIKENGVYRCRTCTSKNAVKKRTINTHKRLYDLFLQKCEEHDCIPITTLEEFGGSRSYVKYICPLHGQTSTWMSNVSSSGAWCKKCANLKIGEAQKLTSDAVNDVIESKNDNVWLNPGEYIGSTTRNLRILCGRCNSPFTTSLASIQNGSGMCPDCGKYVSSHATKYTKEDLLQMATIDGELMVVSPDDYVNMSTKMNFYCSECGNVFATTPFYYLKGGYTRCQNCWISSQGQEDIDVVLKEYGIERVRQKTFDDCRDKRKLPFDFYLPKYNLLIEFNGEQHYRAVEYFGGKDTFTTLQKHDRIKKEYAEMNGFNYLVITYKEQNDIRNILISYLKLE